MTSPSSMHETALKPVHWNDPEGWDEEGGSGWGTHVHPMADSCQCTAKTTTVL